MSIKAHSIVRETIKVSLLTLILSSAFYPLYVMVAISFKSNEQFVRNPWGFDAVSEWNLQNWVNAWGTVSPYIANSFFVAVTATAFGMAMAIVTSYVIARYRFPGRSFVYYAIMATMFLPGTAASLVTLFNLLRNMNLMNNLWAVIIVTSIGGQMSAIFILRQFVEDIPKDLFDSATIDGAGHFAQIRHILLPMSGSIIGVLTILKFLGNWNELMLTLVVIRDEQSLTIPVGLMRMDAEYVKEWGELMAGYSIAALPLLILFLFTMKLFVKGLTAGALKG